MYTSNHNDKDQLHLLFLLQPCVNWIDVWLLYSCLHSSNTKFWNITRQIRQNFKTLAKRTPEGTQDTIFMRKFSPKNSEISQHDLVDLVDKKAPHLLIDIFIYKYCHNPGQSRVELYNLEWYYYHKNIVPYTSAALMPYLLLYFA